MSTNMDDRLERERTFHDHRFDEGHRAKADRFYRINRRARSHYEGSVLSTPPGSATLELGCGVMTSAFDLANKGVQTSAIDISPATIENAKIEAEERGVHVDFQVMNAEALEYPDDSFDVVLGGAILHHLQLEAGLKEIRRVLKPGGRIVFREPLGHNPAINLYRKRTPGMRTPDEHPLLRRDLRVIKESFPAARFRFYNLFTFLAVPFQATKLFRPLLTVLERIDSAVLRLPFLQSYAWVVVIEG